MKYLFCSGCKCGKYMIRAGFIQDGVNLIKSFNPRGEPEADNDSPCHWFLLEVASAYQRKGDYRNSLAYCLQLRKSFENIWEDQLDFHVFCLSKMRLCSYVELLRLEDTIYHNQDYRQTAHIAIQVLLKLHDDNRSNNCNQEAIGGKSNKKKNKQKNKKEQKNNAEEDNSSLPFSNLNYLEEATRFLKPLQEMFNSDLDTYLVGFEISKRKKKPLQMLQNVLRLQNIEQTNEKVLENVIFLKEFISTEKSLADPVLNVLDTIKF